MLPPWILIGAFLLLMPIFTFMAASHIQRQKDVSTRLLEEKGAALIRSFEAGTRTGMMGMPQGGFRLQRLLTETAEQPDIAYLFVTDTTGRVLAHNDPEKVGTSVPSSLDLLSVSQSQAPKWRKVLLADGRTVFEVYRKFEPTGPPPMGQGWRRHLDRFHGHRLPQDIETHMGEQPKDTVIFVGLSMDTVEAAHRADIQHTVFMALTLLLIGFAGVILLFLGVRYREARSSLSRIKAFSETVVSGMPMGLVAMNMDGKVAGVNPVAANLLGVAPDTCLGQHEENILPGTLLALTREVREKGELVDKEIDCALFDGRHLPLQVSGRILQEAPGTDARGYVLLIKDLTEIDGLRKEILRSQKLASVGRLAGGVAHEIRNPLSSIKGFAVYFKQRYADVPEDRQIADIMIGEVERLNRVVSQLVDFSRPLVLARRPVAVEGLATASLKLVQREAQEKKIRIVADFDKELPRVTLDTDRINQVLLNLYLNAIEAMPAGGTLRVMGRLCREEAAVAVEIEDTGAGIAPEAMGQVFDPYFTTKPSGTGLGLAIVHNIVEAHGGKIRIHSRVDKGTTVSILLPVSPSGRPCLDHGAKRSSIGIRTDGKHAESDDLNR